MLYASVKVQLKITFFRSKQDVFKYRASPDDMCNKLQARLIHMHFQLIYGTKSFIFDYRIYYRKIFFNEKTAKEANKYTVVSHIVVWIQS